MARHWIARAWGSPDHWEFVDYVPEAPGPGEVTIAVRAAGVNPADAKHVAAPRTGKELPVAIGYEVSGTVTAVGPRATAVTGPLSVGDEVLAFRVQGGYATELTVSAEKVLHKPSSLAYEEAANLLLAGTTAAEMLHAVGASSGDVVLLHAASGAVGVIVLQLAALRGITVIGTASEARFEEIRGFGGIPVRYGPGLQDRVEEAVRTLGRVGVDAALDAAGTDEAVDVSLALVADRTRIVTVAAPGRAVEDGFQALAGTQAESAEFRDAARQDLVTLAGRGLLRVPLSRSYPLPQARDALGFLADGHPGGKITLVPDAG
ncbi:NADP-dependent oxidoreductase [Arthrobacter sp. NPDC090010]|uniref:NADP-dependent oxidoreductase n=1 Tax=Arthrobacter sp. NPDC090010 TaxID=3363942 RepID=UPI003815CDF2